MQTAKTIILLAIWPNIHCFFEKTFLKKKTINEKPNDTKSMKKIEIPEKVLFKSGSHLF